MRLLVVISALVLLYYGMTTASDTDVESSFQKLIDKPQRTVKLSTFHGKWTNGASIIEVRVIDENTVDIKVEDITVYGAKVGRRFKIADVHRTSDDEVEERMYSGEVICQGNFVKFYARHTYKVRYYYESIWERADITLRDFYSFSHKNHNALNVRYMRAGSKGIDTTNVYQRDGLPDILDRHLPATVKGYTEAYYNHFKTRFRQLQQFTKLGGDKILDIRWLDIPAISPTSQHRGYMSTEDRMILRRFDKGWDSGMNVIRISLSVNDTIRIRDLLYDIYNAPFDEPFDIIVGDVNAMAIHTGRITITENNRICLTVDDNDGNRISQATFSVDMIGYALSYELVSIARNANYEFYSTPPHSLPPPPLDIDTSTGQPIAFEYDYLLRAQELNDALDDMQTKCGWE